MVVSGLNHGPEGAFSKLLPLLLQFVLLLFDLILLPLVKVLSSLSKWDHTVESK